MTKLTQQEIEKEAKQFMSHINGASFKQEYKNNPTVKQVLNLGNEVIAAAIVAWLARAELAKGGE